jgi:hypothetical protein
MKNITLIIALISLALVWACNQETQLEPQIAPVEDIMIDLGKTNANTRPTENHKLHTTNVVSLIHNPIDGSLNKLFEEYQIYKLTGAEVLETSYQHFEILFNGKPIESGTYMFPAHENGIGMIFKGDPTPQPNVYDSNPYEDPTPTPAKVWIDNDVMLDQEIASIMDVDSFILKHENIYQNFDIDLNTLTVVISLSL